MDTIGYTFENLCTTLADRWHRGPEEVYTHSRHIGGRGPVLFASVNGDMRDVGRSVEVRVTGSNGRLRYWIQDEAVCERCGAPATAAGLCDDCNDELAYQEWQATGLAAVRGVL